MSKEKKLICSWAVLGNCPEGKPGECAHDKPHELKDTCGDHEKPGDMKGIIDGVITCPALCIEVPHE